MTPNPLAAAMVAIQSELKNPAFDSTNPHFRNKYPSLAGVRDAIVPLAAKHGISVTQNLLSNAEGVGCETILMHVSGEAIKYGPLFLPAAKHDPQGFGSCATYARRYSLLAAFNVVGDEDDDANKGTAAHNSATKPLPAHLQPPPDPPITKEAQRLAERLGDAWEHGSPEQIYKLMKGANDEDNEQFKASWRLLPAKTRNGLTDAYKSHEKELAKLKGEVA